MSATKTAKIAPALACKEEQLVACLERLQSVAVAYSGGVDSSLLAYYARRVLGARAKIVIALSPSLARGELDAAREQAKQFDFDLIEIATDEVALEEYRENGGMRCFFCKSTLFEYLEKMKAELGCSAIAYGANMDDLSDVRPGHQAAAKFNVAAPLLECGLYKSEIRELARAAGLPSFDRPQAACLSSRFPTNVYIEPERLSLVDRAEDAVRQLGFRQVRVRFRQNESGPIGASVEVGEGELDKFVIQPQLKNMIVEKLLGLGFVSVSIDPLGYRQGGADALSPVEKENTHG